MPFAKNGRARIYYETRGNRTGPGLLMVKGLARSHRFWLNIAELFERDFHVIHMDNRGVGKSDSPPPPYTTREMAADMAAVIRAAGLGKVHYLGISLAGMIGQWLALDYPELVDRVVLAATTAGGIGNSASARAIASMVGSVGKPFHVSLRQTAPIVLTEDFRRRRPDVLDVWEQLGREEPSPWYGLVGQSAAGATHDTRAHLRRLRAETLILTGTSDVLIPTDRSYRLAELVPDARLHVFRGVGHDFPTEIPEETHRMVARFLTKSS